MKNLKNVLNKPLHDCRLWGLWIWNRSITEIELATQLESFAENGFGGVAIRPGREMYPAWLSEEFFALFQRALHVAHEKNIKIRLADDYSLSWDTHFQKQAEKNSTYRAARIALERHWIVTPKDTVEFSPDDLDNRIILACKVNDKKIDPGSVRHITGTQKNLALSWKSPGGDWQVMIFRKIWCLDPLGHFLPNVFNTKVAQFYIQEVLEPFLTLYSRYIPSTFEGFINEMPSYLPSENGIPWDDDLIIKYRSRYKKNIVEILPCLFFDIDDSYAKNRSHVYNFLVQSMYERFASLFEAWAVKNNFSQWLLCPERDINWSDHSLKDLMALPPAEFTAVGIQNQDGTEKNYPIIRALADANAIEFSRETIGVIGRNRLNESATLQSLKSEIDMLAATGASKIILDGCFFNVEQRSYVKTPPNHSWYHPEWSQISHLCEYTARLLSLYKNIDRNCFVAIVLPASSLMADFLPSSDSLLRKGLQLFNDVVAILRAHNLNFDVISEQVLLESAVREDGFCETNGKGKKRSYSVVVFPYVRLVNNSIFVFLEKLSLKKGTIIFIDEPPQGNFDDGKGTSFDSRVGRLIRPRNENVHVVPVHDIITIVENNQRIAYTNVGGKPCSDIKSTSGIYRQEYQCYSFQNESNSRDYFVSLELPDSNHLYLVDCTKNEIVELEPIQNEDGYCGFDLDFAPRQNFLVITSSSKIPHFESERKADSVDVKQRNYRVVLKDKWAFTPHSFNGMPLASLSKRIGLSRDSGGFSYYYETYFEIEEIPQTCILVFFDTPAGSSASYHQVMKDFELSVNGIVVSQVRSQDEGSSKDSNSEIVNFFGRSILKYNIKDTIMKGINRVAVRNIGLTGEPRPILFPPIIAGNFSIKKGARGWTINSLTTEANYGSWTKNGFPYLSGTGLYHQIFEIPSEYERIILKFNQTSGFAAVDVNDVSLGIVRWQPMSFDITKYVEQRRNSIKIKVVNTIDNLIQMKNRPSGLIGEVFLDIY